MIAVGHGLGSIPEGGTDLVTLKAYLSTRSSSQIQILSIVSTYALAGLEVNLFREKIRQSASCSEDLSREMQIWRCLKL